MAHSQEIWDKTKSYYEAGLALSDISERVGISKGQISKKAAKEHWSKGNEKKQLIDDAVGVIVQKETLKETDKVVHDELVGERAAKEIFFSTSSMRNQKLTNEVMELDSTNINVLEAHSRITQRNKDTVLGKDKVVDITNTQQIVNAIEVTFIED